MLCCTCCDVGADVYVSDVAAIAYLVLWCTWCSGFERGRCCGESKASVF